MQKEEFVLDYYGTTDGLSKDQMMLVESQFSNGTKGVVRRIVNVNYTDSNKAPGDQAQEKAVCSYIQYGSEAGLSEFYVKGIEIKKNKIFDYFSLNKLPKGLDPFGVIRL